MNSALAAGLFEIEWPCRLLSLLRLTVDFQEKQQAEACSAQFLLWIKFSLQIDGLV
jgi:hypothetical protein